MVAVSLYNLVPLPRQTKTFDWEPAINRRPGIR